MDTKTVRVRPREGGGAVAVRHPETGAHVVPIPGEEYPADHPLVRAYPWLFVDPDAPEPAREYVTEVKIETAAQRPGRRRTRA